MILGDFGGFWGVCLGGFWLSNQGFGGWKTFLDVTEAWAINMGSYGLIPVELWVFFSPHGPFWGPFWVILGASG